MQYPKERTLLSISGLTILEVRGYETDQRKKKWIEPRYILFDDCKTYIELEDQDYHTYHDYSASAKHINVIESEDMWCVMHDNLDGRYPIANADI